MSDPSQIIVGVPPPPGAQIEIPVQTLALSGFSGYSGSSGPPGGIGVSGFSGYSAASPGPSGYSGYSGSGLSGYSGSGLSGYSGSGVSGFSGYSGLGLSGYSGYSGSGLSGYSGSGISGYSGSGISGYSGYSGLGLSGYSGYSGAGVSGYSGYSSLSGYSGYSGSGISGYSGSGVSGYSGYSAASPGPSGYSGYSAVSGYSGYSSVSGFSGFSGSGGAVPGGSNTQVQYNNAGAFGGSANFTWANGLTVNATGAGGIQSLMATATDPGTGSSNYNSVTLNNAHGAGNFKNQLIFAGAGTPKWTFGNDSLGSGGDNFFIYGGVSNNTPFAIEPGSNAIGTTSAYGFKWANTSQGNPPFTYDTGIARNASGIVEVNNGTAGSLAFLKADRINAFGSNPSNASVASVSAGYASDTYLAGSSVMINTAGAWRVGGAYHLILDMTKTGAGTATPIFIVRMGTAGTTADAAILTLTFGAGTAVADTGVFELWVNFRTVGSGTSAVIQGVIVCHHHLAATGLTTTGAAGAGIIVGTSAGFNSTTPTILGVSFNGGTSFSGTNTLCQAQLIMP